MLKAIPSRPKPKKVNEGLLKSWEFRDTNDRSIIRVLKAVGLLNDSNEPTEVYTKFMDLVGGPPVLGAEIKKIYAPLFTASHTPFNESAEKLNDDIETYHYHPKCDDLIFFIYDPDSNIPDSASLQRHLSESRTYGSKVLRCHGVIKP